MAVFLVNQCTFSKLPNVNSDQQTTTNNTTTTTLTTNGGQCCQPNHNSNDSTTNLSSNSVGLSPSNICGLKFDSLFELIHHIEDNHITDVDYPGIASPFYNGHPQAPNQQQQPTHHPPMGPHIQPHGLVVPTPIRDSSNIYNVIPDRSHMTQIINGGWLPTSCILRIFNSTRRPHKQQQHTQQQQVVQQQPTHHLRHKLQAPQHHLQAIQPQPQQPLPQQPPPSQLQQQQSPQPQQPQIKYETGVVMSQSQDSQQQANVITGPLGTTHMVQPQMATIVQPQLQAQQGMHPQQMIVQLAQAPMQPMQPQQQPTQIISNQPQQPVLVTQTIGNSIQTQQQQTVASPTVVATVTAAAKPTKYLKCPECNKTYKTAHGLRAHQVSQHPNSPHTEGKIMAIMPEGGDTSSRSPAPIYQQQTLQHQQQSQPMMIEMVQQQQQKQQQQQQPMMVEMVQQTQPMTVEMIAKQQSKPTQIINSPQQTQTINNSIQPQNVASATAVAPITNTPKQPAKVLYKCTDCNKTYKTVPGLTAHQKTHHSNSAKTDGKTIASIPEGGDTSSGSPAPLTQQPLTQTPQPQTPQQQQPPPIQQPMTVNMVLP